jgi:hypothetical protein
MKASNGLWKERFGGALPEGLAQEIDTFETEIELRKRYMPFGGDNLDWLAIHRGESRPQHFVPAHNLIQATFKGGYVETRCEAYTGDKDIRRTSRHELIQEP